MSLTYTIIVPIHNSEKTLERCVNSIINSTFQDFELFLIDDNSTDNSRKIIKDFQLKDKRISIYTTDGLCGGVSCARNLGISKAKGKYLSFIDSDDYIDHYILEKCNNIIKLYNPDLLDFNFYYNVKDDISPNPCNSIIKNKLLDRNYIEDYIIPVLINVSNRKEYFIESFMWNKLFKTEILQNNKIFLDIRRKKWVDRPFIVKFTRHINSFYSMPDYGYYYCYSDNHLSKTNIPDIPFYVLDAYEQYTNLYGNKYNFTSQYCIEFYLSLLVNLTCTILQEPIDKKLFFSSLWIKHSN